MRLIQNGSGNKQSCERERIKNNLNASKNKIYGKIKFRIRAKINRIG